MACVRKASEGRLGLCWRVGWAESPRNRNGGAGPRRVEFGI